MGVIGKTYSYWLRGARLQLGTLFQPDTHRQLAGPWKPPPVTYLVEPMVQEDDVGLARGWALLHQHIAWVRVTVDKAIHKDHFTVEFPQVARDL